ncbi:MAG: carbohydrate-binding family V/XII, partial [Gammaproteobacteria bacterium]
MGFIRAFAAFILCLNAVTAAAAADWPREVRSGDATIVLYQPQFDSLDGIDTRARIAVAIQRPNVAPEFGALWVAATLDVDRDEDTARFETFVIERARFPDATEQEVRELTALIERAAPTWDLNLSLTELRASLEAEGAGTESGFRNDPPRILYRDRPAILVTLDGEPRLQLVEGSTYQRVINTPFPIVFDPATREYWLFGSEVWFTTRDLVRGPWSPRDSAPTGIAGLFAGTEDEAPPDAGEGVPREKLRQAEIIVTTTTTAELISTDGPPQYRPLVGDEMLYVTNTGSDLFLEVPTKQYYVVLSGRWYRAPDLAGPWTYVDPTKVPRAFADVPRKSDKSEVLAHVPGTDEAKDAVMDSMIPQTSAVRRSEARLDVTYDGSPRFEKIPGTSLLYASNTPTQVLMVRDRYYAVDQGVWYVAESAYGPWEVADERPEEVENIPPSSPAYNVKYVYIYDSTPDVVYVGYLP